MNPGKAPSLIVDGTNPTCRVGRGFGDHWPRVAYHGLLPRFFPGLRSL